MCVCACIYISTAAITSDRRDNFRKYIMRCRACGGVVVHGGLFGDEERGKMLLIWSRDVHVAWIELRF